VLTGPSGTPFCSCPRFFPSPYTGKLCGLCPTACARAIHHIRLCRVNQRVVLDVGHHTCAAWRSRLRAQPSPPPSGSIPRYSSCTSMVAESEHAPSSWVNARTPAPPSGQRHPCARWVARSPRRDRRSRTARGMPIQPATNSRGAATVPALMFVHISASLPARASASPWFERPADAQQMITKTYVTRIAPAIDSAH